MSYKIKKVAVLGSGVMGSGIACHLANVGIDVLMLDIVPKDIEKDKNRNVVADESLARVVKSKPNPIYNKEFLIENPMPEQYPGKEDRFWAKDMVDKDHKYLYDGFYQKCNHFYTSNGATWKGIG